MEPVLRVDLKNMDIEVSTMFVHEEEDFSSQITVNAKVASDKGSYAITFKHHSKNIPKTMEAREEFVKVIGECVLQAAAQAEEQLLEPVQLSLFDQDQYVELSMKIAGNGRDTVSQEAAM
jgi:hypothetical protein